MFKNAPCAQKDTPKCTLPDKIYACTSNSKLQSAGNLCRQVRPWGSMATYREVVRSQLNRAFKLHFQNQMHRDCVIYAIYLDVIF